MADGGMVQTAAAAVGVAPGGGAAYMTPATPVVPLRPPMSRLGHRRSSGTDEFALFPDPGQVELVVSKTSSELFSRSLAESWWSPATETLQKQVGLCVMIHYSPCRPVDSIGRHTRRRMHGIFGERERANWGRVSTPTCTASLVSAASQSREAPPRSGFSAISSPLSG